MCKEMPVILVNKVVYKKRIIGKMEGPGRGEAQGVADPKKVFTLVNGDLLDRHLAEFLVDRLLRERQGDRGQWRFLDRP
jgi:hypothetical protein